MKTEYVISKDGAKIAYSVTRSDNNKEALLLMHGSGQRKEIWEQYAWVDSLKKDFTVIAMDIRGFGESDKSHDSSFYNIQKILDDILSVTEVCDFTEFNYFGHSYGATIGMQALANSLPIKRAILASGAIGDEFFKKDVPVWIDEYTQLNEAKKKNDYSELSEEDVKWLQSNDLDNYLAQFRNWITWPGISIDQIHTPTAIYTGTHDVEYLQTFIKENQTALIENNIISTIFNGLNHADLIQKRETLYPFVSDFLTQAILKVKIDRPLGSSHPEYPEMIYPINYGYVEGFLAPDGEEQDVYILGVNEPIRDFIGKKIAIIHRNDDIEEKWVTCPLGTTYTKPEIEQSIHFQEQYFDSYLILLWESA